MKSIYSTLILFIVITTTSFGIELNGHLTSELYGWTDTNSDHIRPYESLRANLKTWQNKDFSSLTFHTYMRWTTDLKDKSANDPEFYIYDAYLKYKNVPKRVSVNLGRQFAYNPIGSAVVDGLRINFKPLSNIDFNLFGGSEVDPLNPEDIRSISDYGAYGGRIAYRANANIRAGINWMLKRSDASTTYHRAGIDVDYQKNSFNWYNRLSINIENQNIAEYMNRLSYSTPQWYLAGEIYLREPSVTTNSIFSIIEYKRYKEVRTEIRRLVWKDYSLFGTARINLFDSEDNSQAFSIGLRNSFYSLSWVHQNGYGGDNDALSGYITYRIDNRWSCYGRAYISRYKVQTEQDDRNDAYSTGLGITRKFSKEWNVRLEWQYLRNAVKSSDNRILFRVVKGFSIK